MQAASWPAAVVVTSRSAAIHHSGSAYAWNRLEELIFVERKLPEKIEIAQELLRDVDIMVAR